MIDASKNGAVNHSISISEDTEIFCNLLTQDPQDGTYDFEKQDSGLLSGSLSLSSKGKWTAANVMYNGSINGVRTYVILSNGKFQTDQILALNIDQNYNTVAGGKWFPVKVNAAYNPPYPKKPNPDWPERIQNLAVRKLQKSIYELVPLLDFPFKVLEAHYSSLSANYSSLSANYSSSSLSAHCLRTTHHCLLTTHRFPFKVLETRDDGYYDIQGGARVTFNEIRHCADGSYSLQVE